MAALRGFGRTGEQVDPFNAGEPELPWEEPDAWDAGGEKGEAAEKGGAAEGEAPRAGYAPHGSAGGNPHKRADGYQAPTTRGGSYDAPSIDEPAPRAGGTGGARKQRKRRGGCGCATAVAIVVVLFVGAGFMGSVASCVSDLTDGSIADSYQERVEDQNAEGERAEQAVCARLDDLLADPASGELHDLLATYLDAKFEQWLGNSATELGIDADAWATWFASSVSYEPSDAYAYSDGTASVWVDLIAPDAYDTAFSAYQSICDYLYDQGIYSWDGTLDEQLDDEQRAEVLARFQAAVDDADVPDYPDGEDFEATLEGDEWTVDDDTLRDDLQTALGLY